MKIKTAVILAGGKGARLDRPDTVKALVKVGTRPLILRNILQLQDAGVDEIFISISHRGKEIIKELINNDEIKSKLHFLEHADDSRKGIIKAISGLEGIILKPFFLVMSDLFLEREPYSVFSSIPEDGQIVSLVDVRKEYFSKCGAQSFVNIKDDKIVSVGHSSDSADGVEIGVYLVTPKSLRFISAIKDKNLASDLSELFSVFCKDNVLKSLTMPSCEWFDINTPATYIRAEIFIRDKNSCQLASKRKFSIKPAKVFTEFSRIKDMKTKIVVERGIIKNIEKFSIIPESCSDSRHFIITDSKVDSYYGELVLSSFLNAGYKVKKLVVQEGESSKNINVFANLADDIFSYGLDKRSFIISLGGGVVNNIAGFLASTLYRGVGLIHVPTNTMSQVDAAIDFKQAVNSSKGKNLLGSYYPASFIVIDPETLSTLDSRNLVNGISESIKHALTQDIGFFKNLIKNYNLVRDISFLEEVLKKTLELKVPLLNGDVNDDYNEMIPQYGHSIGHAIEHLSSYELMHGEAVAIGMCVSAEISKILGICSNDTVRLHYEIFSKYNLPTQVPNDITDKDIENTIRYDKHYLKGNPQMALVSEIGKPFCEDGIFGIPIDYSIIRRAIEANKKNL